MTLTCLCCGFAHEFVDDEAAFQAGWDTPARFTVGPFCDLCPSAPVVIKGLAAARARHADLHARWARDGRPAAFSCADEYAADGLTAEEAAEADQKIAILKQMVDNYRRGSVN